MCRKLFLVLMCSFVFIDAVACDVWICVECAVWNVALIVSISLHVLTTLSGFVSSARRITAAHFQSNRPELQFRSKEFWRVTLLGRVETEFASDGHLGFPRIVTALSSSEFGETGIDLFRMGDLG